MGLPIYDNDSVSSSSQYALWTGADMDLVAAGGSACRWVRATIAGAIALVKPSDGTTVIINFIAGETQYICATKILLSGTTATGISIYW